jgi:O-antigen chain-terminating methyltransferase
MDLASQVRLVRAARAALRPGGILILETPSPLSLVAGSINFLRDPTHVRPLHPDTLAYIVESEGFTSAEIELLAPVPPASRVPRVDAESERDNQINTALDVIDEVLFGHQDFAVIGTR